MDSALKHDFTHFLESRFEEAECDFEKDSVEHCCKISYIQGFCDAFKILSGDF